MGADPSADTGNEDQSALPPAKPSAMPGLSESEAQGSAPEDASAETGDDQSAAPGVESSADDTGGFFSFGCSRAPRLCDGGEDDEVKDTTGASMLFCCPGMTRAAGDYLYGEKPDEQAIRRQKYRNAFDYFDDDNSNTIDKDEMAKVMSMCNIALNDEQHAAIFDDIDDAGVTFEQFAQLLEENLDADDRAKIAQDPSAALNPMQNNLSSMAQYDLAKVADQLEQNFDEDHADVSRHAAVNPCQCSV